MVYWSLIGAVTGLVIIAVGVILGWAVIPPIIDDKIADSVAIIEGTDQFKRWETLPQPILFKVYFFIILNPAEVHVGVQKPKVKEVGPYVYQQSRVKTNITFSEDGKTVSYIQHQTYKFDEELSGGLKDTDEIIVLNPYMNSIFQLTELKEPQNLPLINGAVPFIFDKPLDLFVRTTVKEFLFEGVLFCNVSTPKLQQVCDTIIAAGSTTLTASGKAITFALFRHKQDHYDGIYEVATGVGDIRETTVVRSWNKKTEVSTWKPESTCNKIKGTDGVSYQPFQKPEGKLTTFITDICRTVEIFYDREIEYKGIKGLRFSPRGSFLSEIGPEYSNECYCINTLKHAIVQENGCLYKGALDLTTCQNAPMVLTSPHMLNTANEYTSLIEGQEPDESKHLTFLEMEPNSGTPLSGGKRVQFNMFLRKVPGIKMTNGYETTLMPLIWVEESVDLSDDLVDLLNESLFDLVRNVYIGIWVVIGIGIALFVAMIILFVWCKCKSSNKTV